MAGLFLEERNCLIGVVPMMKFRWLVFLGNNGIV